MKSLWTASGKPLGYLTGQNLRTLDGLCIGRLVGTEIYASDGTYLGEIAREHYLVTDLSKRQKRRRPSKTPEQKAQLIKLESIAPLTISEGFADFPSIDFFRHQAAEIHREQIESLLRGYIEAD